MSNHRGIRIKAVASIRRNAEVLLSFAIDPDTGGRYGRLLGGGVEAGERAADAIRREFQEEIGAALTNLRQLGVVENIFTWQGELYHEVVFVFAAEFADRTLYESDSFVVNEAVCDGPATWVDLQRLVTGEVTVYPAEVVSLLDQPTSGPPRLV